MAVLIGHSGARTRSVVDGLIDNIQRYRANLLDRFPRVYAGGAEFRQVVDAAAARDGAAAARHFALFFGRISSLILAGASPLHDPARLRAYLAALVEPARPARG